jgi:hypothetical protein
MTPQEINEKAKAEDKTPKEVLKELSEGPKDAVKPEEVKLPAMQHVIITLADGRQGVFAGPELISAVELKLAPPRLVSIDFSEPRKIGLIAPQEEPAKEKANGEGSEDRSGDQRVSGEPGNEGQPEVGQPKS